MAPKAIPILPSDSFDDATQFYAALGFAERGRWPNEYLILQHPEDDFELHFRFAQSVDPRSNDVACYVRFDTAEQARALHDQWAGVNLEGGHLHPPSETEYGLLEFALVDRHGNLIRIGGPLDTK